MNPELEALLREADEIFAGRRADVNSIAVRLARELRAALADSERYRWLIKQDCEEFLSDATGENCWQCEYKDDYDAAIDAAREKERP